MAMVEGKTFPANPGSFSDFERSSPYETKEELLRLHSQELALFAGRLAEYYGISREELHAMKIPRDDLPEVA